MASILEESKKAKRGFWGFFLKKKVIVIMALVLVAAGALYYFYGRNTQDKTAVVQEKKWTVKTGDIKISVEASGKVVAKDGAELSFPISGNLEVENVYVKEGDKVKKGDKIASVKTETLEFELRNAYASYQSALANFNSKQASPTQNEIDKAKASIDQAQVSLDQAKISLEKTKSSTEQQITNAESSVAVAENNLKLNSDTNNSQIISDAYTDLLSTISSVDNTILDTLQDSDKILGVDDQLNNFSFKYLLGAKQSNSYNLARDGYTETKELKAGMEKCVDGLGSHPTNSAMDVCADKAKAAVSGAQDFLADLQSMLINTITSVDLSQTELDSFKSTTNANISGMNSTMTSLTNSIRAVSNAKSSLKNYQIAYDKAVNDLTVTKEQAAQDVKTAESSVAAREVSLKQAKIDYEDLIAPASESDLASSRAQLSSAAISVDKAKYNMEQATLLSPIDGVISMLNYKRGDTILDSSDSKTFVTIINNDTLFIEANIEEADISKLKVGDKAQVTFDAVDGVNLNGEISFISLTSETSSNGIVTYLVRVLLTNTGNSQVREGMTAAIDFVTAEAAGVLVAPVQAVHNIGGKPSVETADGQVINVTTGFTDGKSVEIISGLKENDVIVY